MATETQTQQTSAPAVQPAPAVQRDLTQPPVGAPVTTTQTIPLTVPEYQRLLGIERQLADAEARQKAAIEEKEQARLKAMAEKGDVERAFNESKALWETKVAEHAKKHQDLESEVFSEKKIAVLTSSLLGRQLLGDTPEEIEETRTQLLMILEPQFEVTRDSSNKVIVRDKVSLRPAADVIKEAFASSKYNKFFAPTSRGGTGSDATRPPANQQQQQLSVKDVADAWRTEQAKIAGQQSFGMFGVNK